MIMDIPVALTVELGRTKISIRNLLQLAHGSVVELDGLAGEPMDVLINGTLIAQGEVVVVNEKFGIRLTDIITPAGAHPQAESLISRRFAPLLRGFCGGRQPYPRATDPARFPVASQDSHAQALIPVPATAWLPGHPRRMGAGAAHPHSVQPCCRCCLVWAGAGPAGRQPLAAEETDGGARTGQRA
jgi:flagellar motor switch protein FliN